MGLFVADEVKEGLVTLSPDESHHVARVLRMQVGEPIALTDGKGTFGNGTIVHISNKKVGVQIESLSIQPKNEPIVHLYVSPTRTTERTEWLIEKATELGCTSICLLICHRTARRNINLDRYEKIAIAAAKQSLNCYFPEIKLITNSKEAFQSGLGVKYIATCFGEGRLAPTAWPVNSTEYSLFIGPEGDFTTEEAEAAIAYGCIPISLGNLRLRTETAAIVGISHLRLKSY
ncbi:ribosomal RNA small subunit methyltransferase E [Thermaurantimonas aggregans]|uniref:Ribosomal RNA small subunit methyltransferase E n=1 Tax=Thermaurantimonas aggregans TaxID=2173829 RepID=A0A401XJ06_9FLAO|nr:RsmE family RNA methyltransferase [Thermaurantimonas aggregans]MCX8148998.1 16S rRNA (uracil(1498)-N(3))-methyltransferase [Thermaurantimonas aggregans]GCD76986.1 ribosomal RNA small subunit methyltransferase E [Thermaurantimonas aggregans]